MTGHRASPVQRGVCKHCRMKFRPKRADADFCGNPCRQAFHRSHKKTVARENAENAFKTLRQRQWDQWKALTMEAYDDFLRNPPPRDIVQELTWRSEANDVVADNLLFEATADGKILAIEARPGALDAARNIGTVTGLETEQALAMLPEVPSPPSIPPRWRRITRDHIIREHYRDHAEVLEFRRMAKAGRRVALITWDDEFRERRYQRLRRPDPAPAWRSIGPHISASDMFLDWEDDYEAHQRGETGEQLLAGGGFHIESK